MNLELHYGHSEFEEALQTFLERRLQFALAAFTAQLGMVTVRIDDGHARSGSAKKRCEITAELMPSGQVVASEANADLYVAVDRAVRRIVSLLTKRTDSKERSNRQHGGWFRRRNAQLPRVAEGGLYGSVS